MVDGTFRDEPISAPLTIKHGAMGEFRDEHPNVAPDRHLHRHSHLRHGRRLRRPDPILQRLGVSRRNPQLLRIRRHAHQLHRLVVQQ